LAREMLVVLDRKSRVALRLQLERALREAVRAGRLQAGATLPSTRTLAADLGVSRGLVVEAYEQLVAEGYFTGVQGSGTIVSNVARAREIESAPPAVGGSPAYDFRPGAPDTTLLRRSRWMHHLRAAFAALDAAGMQYGDPAGFLPLRRALAAYLARVRGVEATADHIVICSGFAGAISLLARLLAERGFTSVAVENPGSVEVQPIVRLAGLAPMPVRVDADGIDVDAVAGSGTHLALLTPAHQFPTGVVLSAERRAALVAWARRVAGFLIEDDYDAEYRYDRMPVGATHGLAPEHVAYAGSLSKTLAPALRLGWLVLPRDLVAEAVSLRRQMDLGNPTLSQAAFALMLESGDYDRHLRRARRVYRRRRDLLVEALARAPVRLTLSGAAAGLHLVATLPPPMTEAEAIEVAATHGVGLYGLAHYRVGGGARAPQALVLGYGSLTERRIIPGLRRLRDVLESLARRRGRRRRDAGWPRAARRRCFS
jgi:GntR family transcriptional regulator/MocR family aminotransferase